MTEQNMIPDAADGLIDDTEGHPVVTTRTTSTTPKVTPVVTTRTMLMTPKVTCGTNDLQRGRRTPGPPPSLRPQRH